MKRYISAVIVCLFSAIVNAEIVTVDKINYELDLSEKTASVAKTNFYGDLVLPSSIVYNDETYIVTCIGAWAFDCADVTSAVIPNSVTTISYSAFFGCSGLTSVTIPNSVTSIGRCAFYGWKITVVISLIENPYAICGKADEYDRTFNLNTFDDAILYVPAGTIDKYKTTEGWKDFAHIEEGEPTGISVVRNAEGNKSVIYDLNGVRQSEPRNGINIINGKKYVKK